MKSDLSVIWSWNFSDSSVLSVIYPCLVRVLSVLSATHLCCPWIRFWADQNCIRGQLIRVLSALYAVHSRSIRGAVVSHQWCIRDSLAFHPQISDYPPICTDDSQMYLGQNTHKIRMYHRWIADNTDESRIALITHEQDTDISLIARMNRWCNTTKWRISPISSVIHQ